MRFVALVTSHAVWLHCMCIGSHGSRLRRLSSLYTAVRQILKLVFVLDYIQLSEQSGNVVVIRNVASQQPRCTSLTLILRQRLPTTLDTLPAKMAKSQLNRITLKLSNYIAYRATRDNIEILSKNKAIVWHNSEVFSYPDRTWRIKTSSRAHKHIHKQLCCRSEAARCFVSVSIVCCFNSRIHRAQSSVITYFCFRFTDSVLFSSSWSSMLVVINKDSLVCGGLCDKLHGGLSQLFFVCTSHRSIASYSSRLAIISYPTCIKRLR